MMNDIEVYVHIPFCIRKCAYCDFLSFSSDDAGMRDYVRALEKEIDSETETRGSGVSSVFFGGGTPSILDPELIGRIMTALKEHYEIRPGAEISIECNPKTADAGKLAAYRQIGFGRISIGAQSFSDAALKRLGRVHTAEDFFRTYEDARAAGFENINIDLISAIPQQTLSDWEHDLRTAAALSPEHISAYSLIIEPGTPFYEAKDSLELPDEDEEREMYDMTKAVLGEAGYRRYEISNYAKPGYECRHNTGYWTGVPYKAFGLGASSYTGKKRYRNTSDMEKYLRYCDDSAVLHEDKEELSEADLMSEFMILGLRMTAGVSKKVFRQRFGKELMTVFGEAADGHIKNGLLKEEGDMLRLSERGLSLANVVMSSFI